MVQGVGSVQLSTHSRLAGFLRRGRRGDGRVARVDEENFLKRAKVNSFTMAGRIESLANGESRERALCNQGWGLGTFSLSRRTSRVRPSVIFRLVQGLPGSMELNR
jgi:hypothetical protein